MGYHYKKKRYRLKPLPIFIAILIVLILIALVVFLIKGGSGTEESEPSSNQSSSSSSSSTPPNTSKEESEPTVSSEPPSTSTESKPASSKPSNPSSKPASNSDSVIDTSITPKTQKDTMWSLLLVNRDHALTGDMNIQKTKFDSQYVDSRAAGAYQSMYDAAKADGITLFLRSGYRSVSEQTKNYNADIQRNLNKGLAKEEAIKATEQYYARPGQSEHHTGLAFDIITPEYHKTVYTLSEAFAKTEAYTWLTEHCTEYGFILRYPKDKVDITKINFEPWHYRYVGVEHAKFIKVTNISLEEYVLRYQKEHPELY